MSTIITTIRCPICGFEVAEEREENVYEVISCAACGYKKIEPLANLYDDFATQKEAEDYLRQEEGKNYIPKKSDILRAYKIISYLKIIDTDYEEFVLKHFLRDYMDDLEIFQKELLKAII